MILKISLRAKAGVSETLVKRKLRLHSLHFPQNSLTLTESSGEFSDLHSIFRLRALRYCLTYLLDFIVMQTSSVNRKKAILCKKNSLDIFRAFNSLKKSF